ncbi:hypothetical protein C7M84_018852 [Penaeus vannamei]|uniref:Organic cation transporter 1 n=1 Tax=Penaeus vannamei TaxID=6689 RepID=A0A3R7MJF5_PENVA|nr:hypothetical protein C7M84_018852 [Penaeus vannamei]
MRHGPKRGVFRTRMQRAPPSIADCDKYSHIETATDVIQIISSDQTFPRLLFLHLAVSIHLPSPSHSFSPPLTPSPTSLLLTPPPPPPAIELVGPSKRTYTTVIMNVAYSCTLILLAGVAYLVRDWAQLALATTIPFLAFFCFWWVLPESPRWLLANGRLTEAQTIMEKMARVNGKPLSPNYMANFRRKFEVEKYMSGREDETPQKSYGPARPRMSRASKTLLLHAGLPKARLPRPARASDSSGRSRAWGLMTEGDEVMRPTQGGVSGLAEGSGGGVKRQHPVFTNTSVYVGLSYYAPALGGDAYLNFFLAGVAELPTYLFLWPSMEYWGRRWTLCFSMVVGGSACVATVVTQDGRDRWRGGGGLTGRKDPLVTLVLYCVGKFGISSSFVVLPLMASELYPTVVRGMGLSVSAVAGMVGPIVIPLINHLGSEMMVLPLIIMGVLLNLGGVFSLMLPETLHQHLPQSLQEGEEFGKYWTMADYCTPSRAHSTGSKVSPSGNVFGDSGRASQGGEDLHAATTLLPQRHQQDGRQENSTKGSALGRNGVPPGDSEERPQSRMSLDDSCRRRQGGASAGDEGEEGAGEKQTLVTGSRKVTVV